MNDERVSVVLRIRPNIGPEAFSPTCVARGSDEQSIFFTNHENGSSSTQEKVGFNVDYVFDAEDGQEVVYQECVQAMVDYSLSGSHCTVLAYGQTGSGKTYTILGGDKHEDYRRKDLFCLPSTITCRSGMFVRIFYDLFRYKAKVRRETHMLLTLSITELYVEEVLDLLNNRNRCHLRNVEDETLVLGATTVEVDSIADVQKFFSIANEFRSVSSTNVNEVSSRSHALFSIQIYQFPVEKFPIRPPLSALLDENMLPCSSSKLAGATHSGILLIDLAGSERIKKKGASDQTLKEAQAINKSLSSLGTVINALHTQSSRIPFQDSKLSRLLKSSFTQPNTRLLLIGQVIPDSTNAAEALSTLRFCDSLKGLKPSTLLENASLLQEDDLALRREHEALCADLRIVSALHYHKAASLKRLTEVKGTSWREERHAVKKSLRHGINERAQAAEEEIIRNYEALLQHKQFEDVKAFVEQMNEKIDEYGVIASGYKAEKKALKKDLARLEEEVESATHEAKRAKKQRLQRQEQLKGLRERQAREGDVGVENSMTILGTSAHNFDEPEEELAAAVKATVPIVEVPVVDEEYDTALLSLVEEFHRHGLEFNRLISSYVKRLQMTRTCRSEVRRMKIRTSDLIISSSLVDDLILFMINRAVDISEGFVPENIGWSLRKDVDGLSKRLKDAQELFPPLLPPNRSNTYVRPNPCDVRFHNITFLSSDDSDDENSHYPNETRRRYQMETSKCDDSDVMNIEDMEEPNPPPIEQPLPPPRPFPYAPGKGSNDYEAQIREEQEAEEADGSSVASEDEVILPDHAKGRQPNAGAAVPATDVWVDQSLEPPAKEAPPLMATAPLSEEAPKRRHRRHHRRGDADEAAKEEEALGGRLKWNVAGLSPSALEVPGEDQGVFGVENKEEEEVDGIVEALMRRKRKKEEGEENVDGVEKSQSLHQTERNPRKDPYKERIRVFPSRPMLSVIPGTASPVKGARNEEANTPGETEGGKATDGRTYLMRVYDSPTLVTDLVKFLRGGTVMMKHGRIGKPHRRLFWISSARGKPELLWMDPNAKNPERSMVKLEDVAYIKLGCFSKVFKRHPLKPDNDAFFRCFTIGLKNGSRTVDMVADTLADFEAWVVGLCWMIGVDPCWGGKPDITRQPGFENLTFLESNLCETNYIMPQDYLKLKQSVQTRIVQVKEVVEKCGKNLELAQRELDMIHPPKINRKGAMLMTKGELRFLVPETKLDIFRISFIWIHFEQIDLIFDPNFSPATSFGVTFRQ